MADLYQALQPHLDEVAAHRAAAAQQYSSGAAVDPEELTLAVMGLPNVVRRRVGFRAELWLHSGPAETDNTSHCHVYDSLRHLLCSPPVVASQSLYR